MIITQRVRSLKLGPYTDPDAEMGPLVTRQALERVRSYVEAGVKEGAALAVDGRDAKLRGYEKGFLLGGCLFDHMTPQMRIYKEEIFGPVLAVVRAADYESALALVNDHEFGKGATIFHPRPRCGARFRRPRQDRHDRRQRTDSHSDGVPFVRRVEALPIWRPSMA